ncbi:hypothetical protein GBA52_013687, partial [Prunus armeniaca]
VDTQKVPLRANVYGNCEFELFSDSWSFGFLHKMFVYKKTTLIAVGYFIFLNIFSEGLSFKACTFYAVHISHAINRTIFHGIHILHAVNGVLFYNNISTLLLTENYGVH